MARHRICSSFSIDFDCVCGRMHDLIRAYFSDSLLSPLKTKHDISLSFIKFSRNKMYFILSKHLYMY